MIHEYTPEEYVRISRKNYDEIKDGYDSKVEDLEAIIEAYQDEIETYDKDTALKNDLLLMESRIANFQNSFIGKFLNFFGVRV